MLFKLKKKKRQVFCKTTFYSRSRKLRSSLGTDIAIKLVLALVSNFCRPELADT